MSEPLHLIESPTYAEVYDKLRGFQQAHEVMVSHARIGGLVSTFSNEELHSLCEFGLLSIGDVLDLRRLGLLAPDEGWTGGPHPKDREGRARSKAQTVTEGQEDQQ